MKKLLAIVLCLSMLITLAACGKKNDENNIVGPGGTYDYEEYPSLEKLNEKMGLRMDRPGVMGVTDKTIGIISGTIAEYQFEINGMEGMLRGSADRVTDISGYYGKDGLVFKDGPATEQIMYHMDDDAKLARWANITGQYVFMIKDGGKMEDDAFIAAAEEMMAITDPAPSDGDKQALYLELAGEYQDVVSQRATATFEAVDDYLKITVLWANSASETCQWVMSARLDDMGRLAYTDETKTILTYAADGTETATVEYENASGYFQEDGFIYWNGASEEACRECAFEKIQ